MLTDYMVYWMLGDDEESATILLKDRCRGQGHRWCCGSAALMVHSAAPDLLGLCPGILGTDGTVEWVASGRWCCGRGWRRSGGWRGRRCGGHRLERCWWHSGIGRGEDCAGLYCWASSANRIAAELLLVLRPQHLEIREALITIVGK